MNGKKKNWEKLPRNGSLMKVQLYLININPCKYSDCQSERKRYSEYDMIFFFLLLLAFFVGRSVSV